MKKYRINTDLNRDKNIIVNLEQTFDELEILSLKFTQQELYASFCSDYGVVCGRISANNGFGLCNVRVSIFVPLSESDYNDPVISKLYPYKDITDKTESGFRYNLLPSRKQHSGHNPTGTFPDQTDILNREEILEVYEKYYKYTVKTNDSGDFMIWGVPLGTQTINIDIDLSDVGCFSLRPDDFIRLGYAEDDFENSYKFKSDSDIDSLPQIINFQKTIEVSPFWGNTEMCDIGISRVDFDISEMGIRIKPKAYLIGGTFTDDDKNSLNKNCQARPKMGRKCDLSTSTGTIEAIRFTRFLDDSQRPILERTKINEDIDESGSFVMPLEMNLDYVYTNEYGDLVYSNDDKRGIPTSGVYRLRMTLNSENLGRTRAVASYLLPNIKEYTNDRDKSYSFTTNLNDYPASAIDQILNVENGVFVPKDYFYRFNYNKVYTVSSFQEAYVTNKGKRSNFLGIKEIVPTEEEDCSGEINTFPVNFGIKNYTFQLLIADVLLRLEYIGTLITLLFNNTLSRVLHDVAGFFNIPVLRGISKAFKNLAYKTQDSAQRELSLINYPECEDCDESEEFSELNSAFIECVVANVTIQGSTSDVDRELVVSGFVFLDETEVSDGCNTYTLAQFISNPTQFNIRYFDTNLSIETGDFTFSPDRYNDDNKIFMDNEPYVIQIVKLLENPNAEPVVISNCDKYDTPFDETIIKKYRYTLGGDTLEGNSLPSGATLINTIISADQKYNLPPTYNGNVYERITPLSGYSEFENGIFKIVPGTQSNRELRKILGEFFRRKRVGVLFCGGIVNYAYIDNWLSGSLYFFAFKAKNKNSNRIKFCSDLIHYKSDERRFYYRSCDYNPVNDTHGLLLGGVRRIRRPTTLVDIGPRDEFINEICFDPKLDPNCSVVRNIGPTSYQNFGEIMGLNINYKMDVSQGKADINSFFGNGGFNVTKQFKNVLDGDVLQLISINSEVGIEGFDLENPKYSGYNYNLLDPDIYPNVYKNGNVNFGPLPIIFYYDEDGIRQRVCLNSPGNLTETSQEVPFYLWNKLGSGFGLYSSNQSDDQAWDYPNVVVQKLQGMTQNYAFQPPINDTNEQYLLPPMTPTFSGQIIVLDDEINDFTYDIVSLTDNHNDYDDKPQLFSYLYVTSGSINAPTAGVLYIRYGDSGQWQNYPWNNTTFIIPRTENNYSTNKQILSTPFMFYFGLKQGDTGYDKFIKRFGALNAFKE